MTTGDVSQSGAGPSREDDRTRAFARLFPHATATRRLETQAHPVGVVAARAWHRMSVALLVAGLAVLLEIALLSSPPSMLGFGWELLAFGVGATSAGGFGMLWARRELRPRTAVEPTTWDAWADARGLRRAARTVAAAGGEHGYIAQRFGSDELHVTPARRFTELYQGQLGTGSSAVPVTVGTGYVRGPWGSVTNLRLGCIAAVVPLPDASRTRLPGSVLDRFVRGRRPLAGRSAARLRTLRMESRDFDDACDLRVVAGSDDLEWFQLLDPPTIAGLARDWPVSWQQHGDTLVVYMPAPALTLDAVQLDTLCLAAQALGDRFRDATSRPIELTPEQVSARTLASRSHRRRRVAIRVGSWLAALAILAVPIWVVTTEQQRESDARMERIDRRGKAIQARYELDLDADLTSYAVLQTAVRIAMCPDRCTELGSDARAEILASDVVDAERLDAVRIVRDGNEFTATSSSEPGGTFTMTWQGSATHEARYRCDTPSSACVDGRWGAELDG